MEAISLALNGRIGGRGILKELNPHWFNTDLVAEFLSLRKAGMKPALPPSLIELYLQDTDELLGLLGAVKADAPTNACSGIRVESWSGGLTIMKPCCYRCWAPTT